MNRRTARLTVRLTPEENQRLTDAAQERGYAGVAQFARASLARSATEAQVIEEVRSLEKRQAATLSAVRTEIARLQRTDYVIFAMLENLAKTILTYLPPPAAENKASVIAQGKAGYERYLKAVGMSLHNGSKTTMETLYGLDGQVSRRPGSETKPCLNPLPRLGKGLGHCRLNWHFKVNLFPKGVT